MKRTPTEQPNRRRQQSAETRQTLEVKYSPVYYRNRTITGSQSSDVRAASERGAHLQSDRTKGHALARLRRRIILIGMVCIMIIILILLFMWQFIGSVQIHGANAVIKDQQRYETLLNDYFSLRPFERFRFALDRDELTKYMATKAPEVLRVNSVLSESTMTSSVTLAMREPVVGWSINSTQYYVDSTGISFTMSYFGQPSVQISDQTGVKPEAGQAFASNRFLGYVGKLIAETKKNNLAVTEVLIPAGTTRQVDVRFSEKSYYVKFSIDRGVAVQVEDMTRAIQYFTSKNENPAYIDVRVENRAYYR